VIVDKLNIPGFKIERVLGVPFTEFELLKFAKELTPILDYFHWRVVVKVSNNVIAKLIDLQYSNRSCSQDSTFVVLDFLNSVAQRRVG
jgi:hypothetical protein